MKPRKRLNFAKMTAFEKGYAVYMCGERTDYPEIPRRYTPTSRERAAYNRGQMAACIEAQDSEE